MMFSLDGTIKKSTFDNGVLSFFIVLKSQLVLTIKKSTFDNGVLFYLFLFFIVLMMFSLDGIDDV